MMSQKKEATGGVLLRWSLFTLMTGPTYIPVIFGTLTQPNATLEQLSSGFAGWTHIEAVERFSSCACLRWRVHLRVDIGWEDTQNQHSHLIVSVLEEDLPTYRKNIERFCPRKGWRWNRAQIDWRDFDPENPGDVWGYVTKKHTHLQQHRCPKRLGVCRRGDCPHT